MKKKKNTVNFAWPGWRTVVSRERYHALLVIFLLPVDTIPLLSRDLGRSLRELGRDYSSGILPLNFRCAVYAERENRLCLCVTLGTVRYKNIFIRVRLVGGLYRLFD